LDASSRRGAGSAIYLSLFVLDDAEVNSVGLIILERGCDVSVDVVAVAVVLFFCGCCSCSFSSLLVWLDAGVNPVEFAFPERDC
jgi:hypothetical protein